MSPRRLRRAPQRSVPASGVDRRESWRARDYIVRPLTGASSTKPYRCPGCEQLIPPATPHVVVWPDGDADAADRRHWHTGCWEARDRRNPVRHRAVHRRHR